jgi:(p)ppGpp synthase/HD superfamily hydrolase
MKAHLRLGCRRFDSGRPTSIHADRRTMTASPPDESHPQAADVLTRLVAVRVDADVLSAAAALASTAHGEQKWGSHPYRVHLEATAANAEKLRAQLVPTLDPNLVRLVALLHDVVEDTKVALSDLAALGVPPEGVRAVALLSHTPGQPREKYLRLLIEDPLAILVKLGDTQHNANPESLAEMEVADPARATHLRVKYAGQEDTLREALRRWGLPA